MNLTVVSDHFAGSAEVVTQEMKRFSIFIPPCLLCLSLIDVAAAQATIGPVCTEIGAFEIYDGTCKNYYICLDDGEKLAPVLLMCAPSAIFNPGLGRCVPQSTSICLQTTTMPPTTTPPTTTTRAPCVRYGRFPIQDINCKRYYLCYWDGVRYAMMDNLSCPNTLVFEPMSEKCVLPTTYICPGIAG